MTSVSGLSESLIRTSAREICVLINLAHTKKVFEPIYKKYSTNKYLKVAQIPVQIREEAQQKKPIDNEEYPKIMIKNYWSLNDFNNSKVIGRKKGKIGF